MRKIFIKLLVFNILCLNLQSQNRAIAPCGNEFSSGTNQQIEELFINNRSGSSTGTIYKIPVVVHVLTNQAGSVSDISNCIIENQIQILNNCFRRKAGAPNTNAAGADAEIEFYLARKTNSGAPTNGINRVVTPNCDYTTYNSFTQINAIRSAANAANWPTNKYLNIFVLRTTPPSPNSTTGKQNEIRGQAWYGGAYMGVFVQYSYLGSKNSGCPNLSYLDITGFQAYDLGMTVVHEVGHYLNLLHTFENCTTGDFCSDTPPVSGSPLAFCGSNNNTRGLCPGSSVNRMWQNYLDYADDACMDRFTPCQVLRMRTALETNSSYTNLITNNNYIATGGDIAASVNDLSKNNSLLLYPNPVSNSMWVERKQPTGSNEFTVLNIEGKIVSQGRLTNLRQEINLRHLQPGFYIFKLAGESRKFVKE
jgi:hypothetical protein